MKFKYLYIFALPVLCALPSCSSYSTVGGSDVAMLHDVTSAFSPNNPFFYQGRKGDYDYFMFYANGRKARVKCPVDTTFIKTPSVYSKEKADWRRLTQEEIPSFMPDIQVISGLSS